MTKKELRTTICAPGKLLISGEYSVLEGYQGLSCATNRKFYCHTTPDKQLYVSNNFAEHVTININKNQVKIFGSKTQQFYLVKLVLQTALDYGLKIHPMNIELDSRELLLKKPNNNTLLKIGLGSSSALVAALSYQIVLNNIKQVKLQDVFSLAYQAHKQYTRGLGSGIDVATAVFGGLISFKPSIYNQLPKITPLMNNKIIQNIVCVYSGYPQRTQSFLNAIKKLKKKNYSTYKSIINRLAIANKKLARKLALLNQEMNPEFIMAVKRCTNELRNLGKLAQINIISQPHAQIAKIAEFHNGIGKPSGAGGGDTTIAFLPLKNKQGFIDNIKKQGFFVVNLKLFSPGVKIIKSTF